MKKITILLTLLVLTVITYAVPARGGWQTKTQPDGTTIQVQLVGDEFYHYWIDQDGNQVQYTADGKWEIIHQESMSATRIARQQAASKMRSLRTEAMAGNLAARGLVILVNFNDVFFKSENTQSAMSDLMNGDNYTYQGATGSTRKYFSDQSDGQYAPEFDVIGPVTLPKNMSYYGGNDNKQGSDLKPGDMVVEACSIANANFDVDFTRYDNDNDGYVDFVYIIYAGKGEADGGGDNTIWPHAWDIASAYYFGNSSYSTSQSVFDGKTVKKYACSGEINGHTNQRTGIGTIVHEFSHVIGLPDVYDIDYGQNHKNEMTPGSWHLMDHGSYCNEGKTPPNYTIYDKYYLGWKSPITLTHSGLNLSLKAAGESEFEAYQITSDASPQPATSTTTAYYIENRQQSGWDAHLPGHGLIIWKVTYDQKTWDENGPNDTDGVLRYAILSASGKTTGISSAADPFPGTYRVTTWNDKAGNILTDITESNGIIQLTYINNSLPEEPTDPESGSLKVSVYANNNTWGYVTGGGYYNSNANATITAAPYSGYHFTRWSDNNTDNPRTITVTQDTTFTALFAPKMHQLKLNSSLELSSTSISMGGYFNIKASVKNMENTSFNGNVAIGLYDENKKFILALAAENRFIRSGSSTTISLSYSSQEVNIPTGSYYVGLVYQIGEDWRLIQSENYTSLRSLGVTYYDALELYWLKIAQDKLYSNGNIDVNINILNTSEETFYGMYRVCISDLQGHIIKNIGTVRENRGLGKDYYYVDGIDFSSTLDIAPGLYLLQVSYKRSDSESWYYIGTSYTNVPIFIEVLDPNVEEKPILQDKYEYNDTSEDAYALDYQLVNNEARLHVEATIHDAGMPSSYDIDFYDIETEYGYEYEIDVVLYDKYYQNEKNDLTADVVLECIIDGYNEGYTDGAALPSTILVEGGKDVTFSVKPYMSSLIGSYEFEIKLKRTPITYYELNVLSQDPAMGGTHGSGRYRNGTWVSIEAIAYEGYHFTKWSDNNTENPRNIIVTQDLTLTAEFETNTYEVIVTWESDYGTVEGAGTYQHGETATLTAIAEKKYKFSQWSDGTTDNPYTFIVEKDISLQAEFIPETAVEDIHAEDGLNTTKMIQNGNLIILHDGKAYNVLGSELK